VAESGKFIGGRGEEAAAAFLKKNGYEIVAANWRAAGAEIDLVASRNGTLCFVEVKTRASRDHGEPAEFVTPTKQRRIIRAAKLFIARRPWRDWPVRFDVITVTGDGSTGDVDHMENAFEE
jgi:putative endonuclease